jgi:uncharacterized iron-regulated protein
MSRHALPGSLMALALFVGHAPADDASRQQALEKSVRQLEKDIAAVRGLAFKEPVQAALIARPEGTAKSLQGYYDIKAKKLFVYDDVSGAYERGVLIHEMVHALQDQHFKLAKLHTGYEGDADLARAALIEGDATFTMIELLKKDQPRVAAMLDAPLEKSPDLQRAFLYAQGARYVRALKESGDWKAVNAAYGPFGGPRTTAQILHPGERISVVDLGSGTTRGELALIALLAANPELKPKAVEAAAGWRGDGLVEKGSEKVWTIVFNSTAAAERCADALSHLPKPSGVVTAVVRRDHRVIAYEAPNAQALAALRERNEGPLELLIVGRDRKLLTFGELTDRLLDADLICVGETHDSDLHHRVQLQMIKALAARDDRLGVGLEMFQRPFQPSLDDYLAGKISEAEFLKATEYQTRWGFEWQLYRPIVEFCRVNHLPVAALNARKELTTRIRTVGVAGLSEEEKKELGEVDFQVKAHRDHWFELLGQMHGRSDMPVEQKERSYQVMTTWDGYMGASAADFLRGRNLRRLVVLAGSGHVENGFGIPDRAARKANGKAVTVRIETGGDIEKLIREPTTDYLIVIR